MPYIRILAIIGPSAVSTPDKRRHGRRRRERWDKWIYSHHSFNETAQDYPQQLSEIIVHIEIARSGMSLNTR